MVRSDFYAPAEYPHGISDHIRREMKHTSRVVNNVPLTEVWKRWILTSGGTQPLGYIEEDHLFACNPWPADHVPVKNPKSNSVPTVLLARGNSPTESSEEYYDLLQYQGGNQKIECLTQACLLNGLTTVRFRKVYGAETFWEDLFGQELFLDAEPEELDLPNLIVSDRTMRAHQSSGGLTFNPSRRLIEIGEELGIPVIFPWG